jgi:hypothetical protein
VNNAFAHALLPLAPDQVKERRDLGLLCSLGRGSTGAETAGRIVLDEVNEVGLQYDTGEDLLSLDPPHIEIHTQGADVVVIPDADEAEEWAAHLAAMARALRTREAGQ